MGCGAPLRPSRRIEGCGEAPPLPDGFLSTAHLQVSQPTPTPRSASSKVNPVSLYSQIVVLEGIQVG